jgi:hypothetical protein
MDLNELLSKCSDTILNESLELMSRANLKHYEYGGAEQTRKKISRLLELTQQSVEEKNLIPMISYIEKMAKQRFLSGFELQEVQTAFNVLEECIWKHILNVVPPAGQGNALALISSVLGSGKDALARTYVSLASEKPAEMLEN